MEDLKTPSGTGPTIKASDIETMLSSCTLHVGHPEGTTSTFVHAYLPGGFYITTGFSACVSPDNFNAEKGLEIAQRDALVKARNELWKLEGYRLFCELQRQKPPTLN